MQIQERERFIGDETPIQIWWIINGALFNFASGYTFTVKVAPIEDTEDISFTKTTGITGAAGSGVLGDGVPNLTIAWSASGELNSLAVGRYWLEVKAVKTLDSSEETYQMRLKMKARLG